MINDLRDAPALNEAKQYIRDALKDGPRPSQELEQKAQKGGIKKATLRRARDALGVICSKRKFNGAWEWRLPDTELGQLSHTNTNLAALDHMEIKENLTVLHELLSEVCVHIKKVTEKL